MRFFYIFSSIIASTVLAAPVPDEAGGRVLRRDVGIRKAPLWSDCYLLTRRLFRYVGG